LKDDDFFILDRKGELLYHSNYNFVLAKRDYSFLSKDEIQSSDDIRYYSNQIIKDPITLKETPHTIALRKLNKYPFIAGVEGDYLNEKRIINLYKYNALIYSSAWLFILLLLIYYIAKSITKPINRLLKLSEDIGEGKLLIDIDPKGIPKNELSLLFKSLKDTAKKLHDIMLEKDNIYKDTKLKEEKLNLLFDTVTDGIYTIDKDFNLTMINKQEMNYLKKPLNSILGKKCYTVFTESDHPCKLCPIKDCLKEQTSFNFISLNENGFRKNCERKQVRISFFPFGKDEFLINIHDMTEVYNSFIKLQQERDKLEITLKSIGDGVIVTDESGCVTMINPIAQSIIGYTENSAIGRNIDEIFHIFKENSDEHIENPVHIALKSKKIKILSNHSILKLEDGSQKFIEDSASPIIFEDRVLGAVLVFRDVTIKRRTEEEIIKSQRLASLGQLAAGIAHNFNNILTSVYGNLSLAKMLLTQNPEKAENLLANSENSIDKAKYLTNQLLTFSKGGSPVKSIASIPDIIKDTVEFILSGSNIKTVCEFFEETLYLNIDKNQISQVFENLAINAKDAMPNGGNIHIEVKKVDISENKILEDGKYIQIKFSDEGVGIDQSILPKIFNPFFSTKPKNTGIGLSICHSIIKNHDGAITVESEKDKGTTFYIYLPCNCKEIPTEKLSAEKSEISESNNQKKSILIVDDTPDILEVGRELFELLGFNVHTASTDIEAFEKFKEHHFDIAIIDLTLQGSCSGEEIVKELKRMNKNFKAIVSSGYSDNDIIKNYENYLFDAALPKPYTITTLKKMLKDIGMT